MNESNEYFFNWTAYLNMVQRPWIKAQATWQWNILAHLIPLFFSESDLLEKCKCSLGEMTRQVWKGKHVSTKEEAAEASPLKYKTHVCMACNTQPTSSVPYVLTAIAKHKACGQSKEERKRHQDYINSWHEDKGTPQRETLTAKPKLWNLPHCKVHAAGHHRVSSSREKAEDGSKKKLLNLCKLECTCFRIPLWVVTSSTVLAVFVLM